MPNRFPSSDTLYPLRLPDGALHTGTVFLRSALDHPRIDVGEYSYASAHIPPEDWAATLAPYLYPMSPERLIIGKFCQIANGVQFITASANHRYDGISSYPFAIFDGGDMDRPSMPGPGADTVVGNDVWIGTGAMILPGAHIGDGVIIGAGAVIAGCIPPYQIVAGNPARVVRSRFTATEIAQLRHIRWWDWPIETILDHEAIIADGDVAALAACTPNTD